VENIEVASLIRPNVRKCCVGEIIYHASSMLPRYTRVCTLVFGRVTLEEADTKGKTGVIFQCLGTGSSGGCPKPRNGETSH